MFIPIPTDTKCAYIRKSAHLKPSLALNEANCFLGAKLSTSTSSSSPSPSFTLYNPYSPNRQQAVCHFFNRFSPATNAITCGDFNSHHST